MRSLILVLLLASASLAQAPQAGCNSAESSQLDFWLGEWNLTWPAQSQGGTPGAGTNTIRKTMDGCVVEEQFQDPASNFRGMSVSTWNPQLKRWQQTWVDNSGSYLDFNGELANGEMTLAREGLDKNGKHVHQRMVFKNIQRDSFDWSWEKSDDGKNWTVVWPIHYTRKK